MSDTPVTTTDQRKTAIEHALAQHSGSLERFRHWTRRIIYTPGVEDMAKICNAYWLIDLVASHQIAQRPRRRVPGVDAHRRSRSHRGRIRRRR